MSRYVDLIKKLVVRNNHTLLSQERLDNIVHCVNLVFEDSVPGNFLEAGVWKGGACILMAGMLAEANDPDRKVVLCDSFEGLPPPDCPEDAGDKHYLREELKISLGHVKSNFSQYDLLSPQIEFIKGFFEESLAGYSEPLAILRCDGDMYSSTMATLEALYPQLSPGGFCIQDDYIFPAVRLACDRYRKKHSISDEVHTIDRNGAFWRKSSM